MVDIRFLILGLFGLGVKCEKMEKAVIKYTR
jgi:hypothetical protein